MRIATSKPETESLTFTTTDTTGDIPIAMQNCVRVTGDPRKREYNEYISSEYDQPAYSYSACASNKTIAILVHSFI
ncbi:hypothetical protein BDV93DRAFT_525322 [Ceratobasidium sp. AG-I]|nr:hypothetical protein BDV93DRAFT_525322 [Ceratobasidium sp. AG-I]